MNLSLPGFEPPKPAAAPLPKSAPRRATPVEPGSRSQCAVIEEVLERHGRLSVHEVAAFCRLTAHEVGKRMNELARAGRVEVVTNDDGSIAWRESPSGRSARVWQRKRRS